MKRLTAFIALIASMVAAFANDSSYNGAGGALAPAQENQIEVRKEVLTIELTSKKYSYVTVKYTFYNKGPRKTITMGFESDTYNSTSGPNMNGGNPHLIDFKTVFNGKKLAYTVKPVINDIILDACNNNLAEFDDCDETLTYAYSFKATFPPGESTMVQTYKYRNSSSVSSPYSVYYKLSPANRWANKRIDDFTLIIKSPNGKRKFYIEGDQTLRNAKWTSLSGGKATNCTVKRVKDPNSYLADAPVIPRIVLNGGSIKLHLKNYAPQEELGIIGY